MGRPPFRRQGHGFIGIVDGEKKRLKSFVVCLRIDATAPPRFEVIRNIPAFQDEQRKEALSLAQRMEMLRTANRRNTRPAIEESENDLAVVDFPLDIHAPTRFTPHRTSWPQLSRSPVRRSTASTIRSECANETKMRAIKPKYQVERGPTGQE